MRTAISLLLEWGGGRLYRAFTLIELLIVVVIIGLLSMALIPKLTSLMAKTRDLKRVRDIDTLASAVEIFYSQKGFFPLRKLLGGSLNFNQYFGSASDIEGLVPEYLSSVPTDPLKSNMIKIHHRPKKAELTDPNNPHVIYRWGRNWAGGNVLMPGEYLYQSLKKEQKGCFEAAAFVAHMETAEYANYIVDYSLPINTNNIALTKKGYWNSTAYRGYEGPIKYRCSLMQVSDIHLCESLEKVEKGQEVYPSKDNAHCKYSAENDLFYVKIIE